MSTRSGLLAGGNWIVDKLKRIDVYPQQDALANIVGESVGNGGSPFNVLIDLAKLGAAFPLGGVGLVGNDAEGEWVRSQCRAHGIDVAGIGSHSSAPTSYTDVMTVQQTGRRTFFHQRGANAFLDDGHFDFTTTSAALFHLGYLMLLDRLDLPGAVCGTVAAKVLKRASEAGLRTSIDVVSEDSDRFARVVLPALPHVDYCILNEFEIERTTGIPVRLVDGVDLRALHSAAQKLIEAGVRQWVIVHFPEGACALGRDGVLHSRHSLRVPQEKIVSTVGAGDAFAAGVLYGLHEEVPIDEALRYGVCSAAACLEGVGTSDGMVPLARCLALEAEYGIRS